jgi:Xaa-Pro dipeptidase
MRSAEETAEFQRRHDALTAAIRGSGIDRYVMATSESIYYFTGASYEPLERPFFLVVGADGSRRMLAPALETEHLAKGWGLEERISPYREFPAPAGQGWEDVLFGDCIGAKAFGFEPGLPWTVGERMRLAGGADVDLVAPLRVVKSDWEVTRIERAAAYADWGIARILRSAWSGASVADTYAVSQALMRRIIREAPNWDPLATKVLAVAWPAPASALPHSVPGLRQRLGSGPHVAMVLSRVNGYAAECERTFFTTVPTADERAAFDAMARAREIAFGLVRPGVQSAEIDATVNAFLGSCGYADFRTRLHRCGHGLGLGNHEPPWLAEGGGDVLAPNMVVSIEPGVYVAGAGGYRHSDTVLVTQDGHRRLTHASTQLEQLVLPRGTWRQRLATWTIDRALRLRESAA